MPSKKSSRSNNKIFLTQNELAERWCITESTVGQKREEGLIPYFRPPNSARILYPIDQIELIEKKNTKNILKEETAQIKPAENKRKMPVNSTHSTTKWEI